MAWLARRRVPAAALADLGNLYGWGKWKRAAEGGGFKPLFGCELEVGGRRFVFLVNSREGYANLMEIFNRREVRDASGLVVIYIPEARNGDTYEEDVSPSDQPPDSPSGNSARPSEAEMLADLRGKVPPGDLYLGADFSNFETMGTCPNSENRVRVPRVPSKTCPSSGPTR